MRKAKNVQKYINNRSGVAMVYAIIVLVLVAIFATTVSAIFGNNLKQAKVQEHSVEAYYLAYSGVQMAFTALIADDNTLFDQIKDGTVASLSENDVPFESGTIDITVTKSTETNYPGWIKITATGTVTENNISRTRTVYIDASNQKNVVWQEIS